MSTEVVAAIDRLTAALNDGQAETRVWQAKMLRIFDEIRASVDGTATDAALSRQTLADCEMHLRTLADHFSPPTWD